MRGLDPGHCGVWEPPEHRLATLQLKEPQHFTRVGLSGHLWGSDLQSLAAHVRIGKFARRALRPAVDGKGSV